MNVRVAAAARRAAAPWTLFALGLCLAASPAHARAEKVLPGRCARCHDADGSGRAARDSLREIPDFNNHKWQASRSDADLLVSILDGKGAHMPSFRGKVGDDEARALVASVRAFDPAPARRTTSAPPDEFERRFRELQEELNDLKKQFREVSAPRRKP
jgi:mono/diheme cytochrome c family protein